MKLLIACNRDSYKNPYVSTLADGLIEQGVDVTCSISEFWNNATLYDVIHIMWPNLLVDKHDDDCKKLQYVIADIKHERKVLISTCHNIKPHYNDGVAINNAYRIVYESCDYIHHLGKASVQLLRQSYPNVKAKSAVVPHHTYDKLYNFNISKREARAKLNIPQNVKVIMSFGSFRDDEERKLVMDLSDQLGNDYFFLMPGFYRDIIVRKNILKGLEVLFNTIKYTIIAKKHKLHICHSYVSDNLLPYYMVSADIMLIQRAKILNSGNVSLAMLAGLPIVGPDTGNVGLILKETGNEVFDTSNTKELNSIIYRLFDRRQMLSINNREYALRNLTTDSVSYKLKELYLNSLREYEKA